MCIINKQEYMDKANHTKSITLKHPFSFEGVSIAEVLKLRNILNELMQHRSISCFAQKLSGKINVYLEDGSLFHTVVDSTEYEALNRILLNEKLLYGEISGHSKMNTDKHLLIKLYYDFIAGNHDDLDIIRLWMRDFAAQLHGVVVPKAKYIGDKNNADKPLASHFIDDAIDVEMEDDDFEKIAYIIDPKRDKSMTVNLDVMAIIPNWASQAGYFILDVDKPIWLAPSCNADLLDLVHQNGVKQGRVINYHNNYDGTYHFDLKFHREK